MARIVTAGLAVVAAALPPAESSAQGRIGAVAAVNEQMEGTPPEQSTRLLLLGDDVVAQELIETTPDGNGHLLFVDQTSLAVAPNSRIVLDRYVFDPDRQAGDVALSLTKGALRFIGGRITKGKAATIRTPTATIGIRGSGAIIEVAEACAGGAGASGCETKVTVLSAEEVTVERYGDSDGDGIDDGPGGAEDDGAVPLGGTLGLDGSGLANEGVGAPGSTGDGATGAAGQAGSDAPQTGPGTVAPQTAGVVPVAPVNDPISSVTLSRPGAVATASAAEGTNYVGLASSAELAGVIASLEGNRDGGAPAVASTPAATVQQAAQGVAQVNSRSEGGAGAAPQQSGGAADVASEEATETGAEAETQLTDASIEDNTFSDELQSDPDALLPMDIPSPGDLAELSGVATFSGVASGVLLDTSITGGTPDPTSISGSFEMSYDFDADRGAIDFLILNNIFSTDLESEVANGATFSGEEQIFGGPNTVSADGNFLIEGSNPAGAVTGNFQLDLVTDNQQATGTFGGPIDD